MGELSAGQLALKVAVEPYRNKIAAFETAQEIREFLAGEGVKADFEGSTSCALAVYLSRESGCNVSVGLDTMSTFSGCFKDYLRLGANTHAMFNFVCNFDRGMYPELVA